MMQRMGVLVGGFRLAAEHHHHLAVVLVELDDHVRALVGGPDVVVPVDAHGVRERPCVKVLADLTDEVALRRELQELRGGIAVGRAGAGAAARVDEDVALRIDGDAGRLAEMHVRRHLQDVRRGFVGDLRHVLRLRRQRRRHGERQRKCQVPVTVPAVHHGLLLCRGVRCGGCPAAKVAGVRRGR
jgi:hypothetical protein